LDRTLLASRNAKGVNINTILDRELNQLKQALCLLLVLAALVWIQDTVHCTHQLPLPSVFGRNLQCQTIREVNTQRNAIGHTLVRASSEQAWKPIASLCVNVCRITRTVHWPPA